MRAQRWTEVALTICILAATNLPDTAEAQSDAQGISPAFPYQLERIDLRGTDMAYVDVGEGAPIVLIHGNPTSSYLWRNIIPHLQSHGRVIAIDLVGFGASDRPDIDFRFEDHREYLGSFIDAMELQNISFVAHDWGSALALDYAANNPENVDGIVLMEALLPPIFPFESFDAMGPIADLFRAFRDPTIGQEMLLEQNFFIEQGLPGSIIRQLSDAEFSAYRGPFPAPSDRIPIWRFTQEVPISGEPGDVDAAMRNYATWLSETETPVLYLYAEPGLLNPSVVRDWMITNVDNLETTYIGSGLHYIQEDQPFAIGRAIDEWMRRHDQ